jgi:benzil reductase ((S)-benzoin forming)
MSGLLLGARFCLVTGASSGIGRAVAVRLSKSGAAVLAVARREELLRETQALGAPGRIEVLAADVTTEAGRAAIAGAVAASGRRLDWVVQNAGAIFIAQAARVRQDQWRNLFELNVHAPLFLLQLLLPHLAPGARVLHVGSGAAHKPYDGWSSYCVTKAACKCDFASRRRLSEVDS